MKTVAHVIGNQFWVAVNGDQLIGTIGVLLKKDHSAVVKSMFVAKEYRGTKVARQLLEKLIGHCKKKKVQNIYLGTMDQMKAAHRFYEKNGFTRITENEVPKDFGMNPVDDVFYRLKL
jgi:N-acetylglutamate synthase-like GNAT family acetyltransferase